MSNIDYTSAKAWPFQQAQKLVKHLERKGKTDPSIPVIFETGYGPSGLPHIGTFGEVARTTWVRHAFEKLTGRPTRLLAFSDDMDGFRKVPTNLPQQEMLAQYLNKPLSQVPDPFGTHESFAAHNNAMLCKFLDEFGFDYEFLSSTQQYKAGKLNAGLQKVLEHHEDICNIVRPTLGEERRKTYSPFLPICAKTGEVLQVPVVATNAEKSTITYEHNGEQTEISVLNGNCKLQWKADWAMRWFALDVDYEMSGKDLIESVHLGGKICRAIGGIPPQSFTYEHFIDEDGAKISKSKGNGLTIDEWLKYGSPESLSLFMYHRPERAKKLFLEIIPKTTDEYFDNLNKCLEQEPNEQLENPIWHLHLGNPPTKSSPISFNMILNLLTAAASDATPELIWGFIERYQTGVNKKTYPQLDALIHNAINYYKDHILPTKTYRKPSKMEADALRDVQKMLADLPENIAANDIQTELYTIGKIHYSKETLKDWFRMIYETLFGTSQGPRLGAFVKIYGIENTIKLIETAINR